MNTNKKALFGHGKLRLSSRRSLCLNFILERLFCRMLVSFDLLAMVITLMLAPGASEKITAAAQIRLALRQVVQEVEFRSALVAGDNEIPDTWHNRKQGEASFELSIRLVRISEYEGGLACMKGGGVLTPSPPC